jgi:YrbI family 3-deoxy-D-manno-octulosonate 8-phosphate phosphatase
VVERDEVLAIIQARGGSKGIPRKNLRLLGAHPLVAYSIANAKAAQLVTRVIVSTDDDEIAEACKQYGAEVPFMRPPALATDEATDLPLFEHALAWLLEHQGYCPQVVVQLRPTSPFRPRGLVDAAIRLLLGSPESDCVRGVTSPNQNPYKMWRTQPDGFLSPLLEIDLEEPYNMPRQKLPATLWQTGHIDAIRYETIIHQHSLSGRRILPIMIENRYCIDIDSPRDLELANWRLSNEELAIDIPQSEQQLQSAQPWPRPIELLVLDFDGVLTDNRVWTLDDGREAVACDRADGLGLSRLRQRGIPVVVLSTEINPVASARCRKLGIECLQGLGDNKLSALNNLLEARAIDPQHVIYVGNDVNDVECMKAMGTGVAVADAHPDVRAVAYLVLSREGGRAAVRELCDILMRRENS